MKDIQKKIWHMREWSVAAHWPPSAILPLRKGVVPVLNPPALSKEHVRVVGNVSSCIDSGLAGFQIFIDYHAIRDFESAAGKRLGCWLDADARYYQLARDNLTTRKDNRTNSII